MDNFEPRFPAVLDSSMCVEYISCPHKFYEKYVLRKRLPESIQSVHLQAGKAFACGMEEVRRAFYLEGESAVEALHRGKTALLAAYGEDRPEETKNHARMLECLEGYCSKWALDKNEGLQISHVEHQMQMPTGFTHPDTGEPLLYCGRIDAIGYESGGSDPFGDSQGLRVFGVDEKTTSSFAYGFDSKWELSFQMLGYMVMSKKEGMPLDGVRIRGVCTGNRRAKWKVADAFLELPIPYEEAICEYWEKDLKNWVERILQSYKDTKFPRVFGESCNAYGGCEFKSECKARLGKIVWREETWNPLAR